VTPAPTGDPSRLREVLDAAGYSEPCDLGVEFDTLVPGALQVTRSLIEQGFLLPASGLRATPGRSSGRPSLR
jgi:hypothetical protein